MSRRIAAGIATFALLAGGCGDGGSAGRPGDPPATTAPTQPTTADGACQPAGGGRPTELPDLVAVETTSAGGMDRITFRLRPRLTAGAHPPPFSVQFVGELLTDDEGAPADVDCEHYVQVTFSAIGVDLSTETPTEVYTGPKELRPAFPVLVEAEQLGDFESQITWGLGLSERVCPRVAATPTELVVEFAS